MRAKKGGTALDRSKKAHRKSRNAKTVKKPLQLGRSKKKKKAEITPNESNRAVTSVWAVRKIKLARKPGAKPLGMNLRKSWFPGAQSGNVSKGKTSKEQKRQIKRSVMLEWGGGKTGGGGGKLRGPRGLA